MLFSIVAVPSYIPTNAVEWLPFLHTFSSMYHLQIFCWWPFCSVWCDTSLYFWIITGSGHIFMCLLTICNFFFFGGDVYLALLPLPLLLFFAWVISFSRFSFKIEVQIPNCKITCFISVAYYLYFHRTLQNILLCILPVNRASLHPNNSWPLEQDVKS